MNDSSEVMVGTIPEDNAAPSPSNLQYQAPEMRWQEQFIFNKLYHAKELDWESYSENNKFCFEVHFLTIAIYVLVKILDNFQLQKDCFLQAQSCNMSQKDPVSTWSGRTTLEYLLFIP